MPDSRCGPFSQHSRTNHSLKTKNVERKTLRYSRLEQSNLKLYGHICRMQDERLVKTLMLEMVEGDRPCGRPARRGSSDITDWCSCTLLDAVKPAEDRKLQRITGLNGPRVLISEWIHTGISRCYVMFHKIELSLWDNLPLLHYYNEVYLHAGGQCLTSYLFAVFEVWCVYRYYLLIVIVLWYFVAEMELGTKCVVDMDDTQTVLYNPGLILKDG